MKSIYNCFSIFILFVIFFSLLSTVTIVKFSYGQSTTFEESEIAITSYIDALIKAPLLISQALVVGVSFVNLFLFIRIMKKESIFFNNYQNPKHLFILDILNNKLYVTIIITCGTIILNMSTIVIIYQASLLSFDLGLDIWSTLMILLSSSVGNIFSIKLITSIFIIVLVYYIIILIKNLKLKF